MQDLPKRYNNVAPKSCWQRFWRKRLDYNELRDRTIITNLPDPQIPSNQIETSKYNYFTFIPINLAEQFTKLANVYFLVVGILQAIPIISISEGKPTILLPLTIVVILSMIKDFIEDLKRHKSDQKENQGEIQVLSQNGFSRRNWQDLQVGNIIKVKKDQYFPCDVILLDHNKQQKTAFIETKNLDGETNLKLKKTSEHLEQLRGMPELDLQAVRIEFSFEKPNPFLSTFNGNVKVGQKKYMIDNGNVILRGCSLKINQWAIGLCVYTGHQTKILLNSGSQKRKTSSLQTYLNRYFKRIFLFQLIVTFLSALLGGIIYGVEKNNEGYISQSSNVVVVILVTWGSWFLSFAAFIPISLLVTVELVRYGQGKILGKDELCSSKGLFAEVQTSNLNQQLGQIQYIMTDKTGTLTQNLMEFKCLYVNGDSFGFKDTNPNNVSQKQLNNTARQLTIATSPLQSLLARSKVSNVDFSQEEKQRVLKKMQEKQMRQCLVHLSLCHNVISEKNQYSSSSPDELALVSFAKFIGFQFVQKNDDNELIVQQTTKTGVQRLLRYKLLHLLDFSSERKRMSVIVEDMNCEDGTLLLLSKGADEIVIPRTAAYQKDPHNRELTQIQQALNAYARQGLRTLVLAQKEIDKQSYKEWSQKYNQALSIIGPERYQIIDKIQSQMERGLSLVGATAIEDKLQHQVKETIQQLKDSNMKVWMLTGDKKETAISIGYSCGLIDSESERIVLDCGPEHAKSLLNNLSTMMHVLKNKKVTIVSGQFIRKIDEESRIILENLLVESESVICCRVSPKDKEFVTKMVKKWGVTLAIGDGANDVNMIHCANVGVGVRGIEGSQATRAADYIITEFRLLKRLVVYHGLNYYHRNSNVMLYTLYKNMFLTFPNLFYGPISLFSATYLYEFWVAQLFNLFFTSFPIVYYGLFDILYSSKEMKQKPNLYKEGQQSQYFNRKILIRLLIDPLLASVFMLYVVFYATQHTLSGKGYMIYKSWSGNLIYAIVVICCNIRVVLMSHQFNIVQGLLCSSGVLLYPLCFSLTTVIFATDSNNTLSQQLSSGLYWLLMILICFVIEGARVAQNTIYNLRKEITYAQQLSQRREQLKVTKPQIEMIKMQVPKEFEVMDEGIKEHVEVRGYAFAEDQNRMSFEVDHQAFERQKTFGIL